MVWVVILDAVLAPASLLSIAGKPPLPPTPPVRRTSASGSGSASSRRLSGGSAQAAGDELQVEASGDSFGSKRRCGPQAVCHHARPPPLLRIHTCIYVKLQVAFGMPKAVSRTRQDSTLLP